MKVPLCSYICRFCSPDRSCPGIPFYTACPMRALLCLWYASLHCLCKCQVCVMWGGVKRSHAKWSVIEKGSCFRDLFMKSFHITSGGLICEHDRPALICILYLHANSQLAPVVAPQTSWVCEYCCLVWLYLHSVTLSVGSNIGTAKWPISRDHDVETQTTYCSKIHYS